MHKINGKPLYLWQQKRDGIWRKVSVKHAPRRLLGVIKGSDEFEFTYNGSRYPCRDVSVNAFAGGTAAPSNAYWEVQIDGVWRLAFPSGPNDSEASVRQEIVRRFLTGPR